MTRICNFPISQDKRCTQPVANGKPNCGRHGCELSADQLGDNSIIYEKNHELHVWIGEPDGLYCLIHNDSAYRVLYQLAGETLPCCLQKNVEWKDEDGRLHRDDGPAEIEVDGAQRWCRHGKLHREDGPAWIRADGSQAWYQYGKMHREDGPADTWADGTQQWYRHGERHREDGPAIIWPGGAYHWYWHGVYHRDDGPAVIRADGTQLWHQYGELHRDDGPATIDANGTQQWYQHSLLHRDDGPAVVYAEGTQLWYWRGERVTEKEHAALRKRFRGI